MSKKQSKPEPQIGDRRVYVCEHTFKEVVQEYKETYNNIGWECLHNDTDEEDAAEVAKYK